ncbi:MAG: hypothetical protein IJU16_01645 [Clostridia bacterium]|nr:hypothetical protein [Clostridia bacterium]
MEQDKQTLWKVFAQTGKVTDYLRYRQAVMSAAMPQNGKEATRDADRKRAGHPGDGGRGSGSVHHRADR